MTLVPFKPRLRNLIAVAIQETGCTQKAIAERLGVSGTTITAWVRGYREPSPSDLIRLSKATGCEWLLDLRILAENDELELTDRAGDLDLRSAGCSFIVPGQRLFSADEAPSFN